MDYWQARTLATAFGFNPAEDFEAMSAGSRAAVVKAADSVKYRSPKTAKGSRESAFVVHVRRIIAKGEQADETSSEKAKALAQLDPDQRAALTAMSGKWDLHRIETSGQVTPPIPMHIRLTRWRRWDAGAFRACRKGETTESFLAPGLFIVPAPAARRAS